MFTRRLQILLDEERYRRVAARAQELGSSVAAVIRECIDTALPPAPRHRRRAATHILGADRMPVGDPDELRRELDDLRARRA